MTGYVDIISDGNQEYLSDYKTSDDRRKEEKMADKYVVSQDFMNELEEWRYVDDFLVDHFELYTLPDIVKKWRLYDTISNKESNNRLITIIRWVNGEDVFEVEKPKKCVVRSKDIDSDNNRLYVEIEKHDNLKYDVPTLAKEVPENATKFDTKEEAESWANAHQEVIEVEE